MVLGEIAKNFGEEILKEFVYADDLVSLGDNWLEVEEMPKTTKV